MSGPTTIIVPVPPEPSLLLMSATALMAAELVRRAAQAVAQAHDEADAQHQAHTAQLAEQQARQAQAEASAALALRTEHSAAHQRWADLLALAQASQFELPAGVLSSLPGPAPDDAAPALLAAHTRAQQALNQQLTAWLDEHLAHHPEASAQAARLDEIAGAIQPDLAALLAEYTQRQRPELLAAVQRALARVAHLPWPDELHTLVKQLAQPLSPERAQALLLELRRQVQALRQAEIARAQAVVLAHTLKDLGYELEEVGDTLFVQGGVMHFRKPGWGDYMVRMRVDAQAQSANFNVIRAVEEGQNERSQLDHLAEDRWCAEFPALLAALEARGMPVQVTRRLEAGELPVQLVVRHKLPCFASQAEAEEASHTHSAPLQQRRLP